MRAGVCKDSRHQEIIMLWRILHDGRRIGGLMEKLNWIKFLDPIEFFHKPPNTPPIMQDAPQHYDFLMARIFTNSRPHGFLPEALLWLSRTLFEESVCE